MEDYSYKTYLKDAKACYELQDYQCAISNSNLAEEFNSLGTELMELKGDLFLNYYKKNQKAIYHYSLSIKGAVSIERKAELLFKRAKVYKQEGQLNNCIEDLLEASSADIDSVNLYLAEIFNYTEHDYPKAIRYYLKEKDDLGESFVLSFGLGFAYYNNRDFDQAIFWFDKSLKLMPTSGESFYFRGLTYNSINEQTKACKDYQKAIELDYSRAYINYQALCY